MISIGVLIDVLEFIATYGNDNPNKPFVRAYHTELINAAEDALQSYYSELEVEMTKQSARKDTAKSVDLGVPMIDDNPVIQRAQELGLIGANVTTPGEGPVIPHDDGWVEFAIENEDELDAKAAAEAEELKQGWHKLHKSIQEGEDERGPYDVIPLSMLRGGAATPHQVYKKPMKHLVVDQSIPPRGWYKNKHERSDKVRPRPCYTEAILTSPYGGYCPVGCSFCYINNGTRGYRSTGIPTVDPGYPEKMAKQVAKMMVAGAGYMTSFSEAFHILEDTYHVTQRLTKVFTDEGLPIFYCTRRLPAEWAIEALQMNPYSYIQWSVNTSNPADYKRLSPGAARLEEIWRYVERLSSLGIYTSFQCNPIHPGVTSLDDITELVKICGQIGLDHIIIKFAEQVANSRDVIVDRLRHRRFDPKKVDAFDSMFNQVIGGVYTIQQDVRVEWLEAILQATREAGITMSTCYEYYDDGKAGANMAPYFTTSDQCHGRGVPVYYRPTPEERFQPFPCYRKGCLYCAEHGTKACNNERLMNAEAWDFSDLKSIVIEEPEGGWDWTVKDSCAHPDKARRSQACNPGLQTDAELWGWGEDEV